MRKKRNISSRTVRKWREGARGIWLPEEVDHLQTLIFEEQVRLAGFLSIVEYPGNERHLARSLDMGHNLIVDLGRASLASLQSGTVDGGGAFGVYDLGYLAVGRGSSGGSLDPDPSDVGLLNETTAPTSGGSPAGVARPILNVTKPPPGPPFLTNLWSAQIGPTEMNQTTGSPPLNQVNEAGLFCLDNATLFAHRTFANQTKSAGFTMEFRWTIIF